MPPMSSSWAWLNRTCAFFERSGKTVSYIKYIEGYPIFANDALAQTQVTMGTESVSVAFSSMNLQIPIPYDGRVKTLPKTATLLKELNSIGIKESEIEKNNHRLPYPGRQETQRLDYPGADLLHQGWRQLEQPGRLEEDQGGKHGSVNGGGKFQLQQLLVFQLFQQ